jgi:hypothetical protein
VGWLWIKRVKDHNGKQHIKWYIWYESLLCVSDCPVYRIAVWTGSSIVSLCLRRLRGVSEPKMRLCVTMRTSGIRSGKVMNSMRCKASSWRTRQNAAHSKVCRHSACVNAILNIYLSI